MGAAIDVAARCRVSTRIGWWLRRLADRIDHKHAPKGIHWSFTFEPYTGIEFNEDGRGCPLWYLDDESYERAHTEGGTR
jgi:hypothetical protein